jgi:non-ribosomal peptide synthetase component E (peptide arylation enzyme)
VAVVAGADPILGEIGVAFVVPQRGGQVPGLDAVRRHVAGILADYKAPDALVVLDELPTTPMGKVDKRALATLAHDAASERAASVATARATAKRRRRDELGHDESADDEGERR